MLKLFLAFALTISLCGHCSVDLPTPARLIEKADGGVSAIHRKWMIEIDMRHCSRRCR
jgi:hypothetical protein